MALTDPAHIDLARDCPWLASPAAFGVHASQGEFQVHPHIRLISDAFRECALKPNGRLIIITPPRHGKTRTASQYGPAWYESLFPERQMLFASYAANFAQGLGAGVRDLVAQHGEYTGARIGAQRARADWTTTLGGGMRSVGARQGAAGRGAHLMICDDLVAGQEEALSHVQQENTWRWWLADFSTRRQPAVGDFGGTSIVVIGTRWSERDFIGRLLRAKAEGPRAEGYEDWRIVYLPAICDGYDWSGRELADDELGRRVGEPLCEAMWPLEELLREQLRKPWWFAALYQGRPEPLQGGVLKQASWSYWRPAIDGFAHLGPVTVSGEDRPVHPLPRIIRGYVSVDCNFLADYADLAKGKERSDCAVQGWGVDEVGWLYLLEREAGIFDIDMTVQVILAMRDRLSSRHVVGELLGLDLPPWPALIEDKANGPAVMAILRRRGITCVPVTPTAGKIARVMSRGDTEAQRYGRGAAFADDVAAGKVSLPHPGLVLDGRAYAWVLDLRHKFAQWPKAGKDDVDAASQAWSRLVQVSWAKDDQEAREVARAEEINRKLARVPKGQPIPRDLNELHAARRQAAVDQLLKAAEKRINAQNVRGERRRGPWSKT